MQINTRDINTSTVNIVDHQMVAANVARVIIATTGSHTPESVASAISEKLKFLAAPIENSFRQIKANVMVGYVRATTAVRVVENDKELRASYKVMASNILMDNADKTLWEVKTGASGKYLARHGNEDLSELVESASTHRMGAPRVNQLAMASVARREFVAFASASGDMDYGFCVGVDQSGERVRVVSSRTRQAVVIPQACIASVVPIGGAKIPKSTHDRIVKAGIDRNAANQEIEYYTRLYSYDPAYLAEVIRQVEGTASM